MTIRELEKVITGKRIYKIDTGCDYVIFDYKDILTDSIKNYSDCIITDIATDDDGMIHILADMVGTDADGVKRNFCTWEKI